MTPPGTVAEEEALLTELLASLLSELLIELLTELLTAEETLTADELELLSTLTLLAELSLPSQTETTPPPPHWSEQVLMPIQLSPFSYPQPLFWLTHNGRGPSWYHWHMSTHWPVPVDELLEEMALELDTELELDDELELGEICELDEELELTTEDELELLETTELLEETELVEELDTGVPVPVKDESAQVMSFRK